MSIEDVVRGYTEALLWVNTFHEVRIGDTLDSELEHHGSAHLEFSFDDFDADDQNEIWNFVAEFVEANETDYEAYITHYGHGAGFGMGDDRRACELFGHDLLLTRGRHGAGFWGRGLGQLGERLGVAARVYGDTSAEVRDGKVVLVES